MTYDEAVRGADMFTAAMAEAGYPLSQPAWADRVEGTWTFRWDADPSSVEVMYKAAVLVARARGRRYACMPCWIESFHGWDRDRAMSCVDGNCPYENDETGL